SYLLEELVTKMIIYHLFEVEVEFHRSIISDQANADTHIQDRPKILLVLQLQAGVVKLKGDSGVLR
ncbi:hypothetical protein Tco_0610893, partial [Tanacetum coccineum]